MLRKSKEAFRWRQFFWPRIQEDPREAEWPRKPPTVDGAIRHESVALMARTRAYGPAGRVLDPSRRPGQSPPISASPLRIARTAGKCFADLIIGLRDRRPPRAPGRAYTDPARLYRRPAPVFRGACQIDATAVSE